MTEESCINSVIITSVQADIRNEHLRNVSQILTLETNYSVTSLALGINLDAILANHRDTRVIENLELTLVVKKLDALHAAQLLIAIFRAPRYLFL
jgi:hypothetical protein